MFPSHLMNWHCSFYLSRWHFWSNCLQFLRISLEELLVTLKYFMQFYLQCVCNSLCLSTWWNILLPFALLLIGVLADWMSFSCCSGKYSSWKYQAAFCFCSHDRCSHSDLLVSWPIYYSILTLLSTSSTIIFNPFTNESLTVLCDLPCALFSPLAALSISSGHLWLPILAIPLRNNNCLFFHASIIVSA